MQGLIEGWVADINEATRHYYRIKPSQAVGNSLCGLGPRWSREWITRHGAANHSRADNCEACNRKRLNLNENATKVN